MTKHALEDLLVAVAASCEGQLDLAETLLEEALEAAALPVQDRYTEAEVLRISEAFVGKGLRVMGKAKDDELALAGAALIQGLLGALPAEA